jgi:O-antigen/teichoic acid export membrane protein
MATIYTAGVSVLLTFLLGRVLGPEAFGDYSYVLTLAALFLILQDGGFKTLLFRERTLSTSSLYRYRDNLFPWALGHTVMLTVAGAFCVLVLPFQYRMGVLAAVLYFGLQAAADFVSSVLKSEGRFPQEAFWQTVVRTSGALGILLVLFWVGTDIRIIFSGWAVGILLCLLWSPVPLRNFSFSGFSVRDVRWACVGFMAIDAATTVYYRCDIILLKYLADSGADVGYYAAAYRFLDGIVLMAAPLRVVWFRKLRLDWMDKRLFARQVAKMCGVMVLAGCLIFVLAAPFSGRIVAFTFGEAYGASAGLLPWLLFALIFILPKGVLAQGAVAQNLERPYALLAGFSAVLNVGLNFWLIPVYGAMGAAWATLVTEGVMVIFLLVRISRIPRLV